MLKYDIYLANIASVPFKLSNVKQPIYYKLLPKIIINYGSFIAHHNNSNYKLLQDYYKLWQKFIPNYCSFITNSDSRLLQITTALLKIMAKMYYKLHQNIINVDPEFSHLLQLLYCLSMSAFWGRLYLVKFTFSILLSLDSALQYDVWKPRNPFWHPNWIVWTLWRPYFSIHQ